MRPTLVIAGMHGLGDNIYQRAFVRQYAARFDLYLETSWPQLYADLPVRFIRPGGRWSGLRTQGKNVAALPASTWSTPPAGARVLRVSYAGEIAHSSIVASMARQLPLLAPLVMDLPPLPVSPVASDKPIALVRPVTVRSEWRNEARAPRPEYIAQLAARLRGTHCVVSVADLADGAEWLVGTPPAADILLHKGELGLLELLALAAAADLIVGGVGWIVPAAIALKRFAFLVLGGNGGHNAPERVTDTRLECSRLGFAMPQRFCRCTDMRHICDKSIPDLMPQFDLFLARTADRCSSGLRMIA